MMAATDRQDNVTRVVILLVQMFNLARRAQWLRTSHGDRSTTGGAGTIAEIFGKIPRSSSAFQDASIEDGETKNTFQIPTALTFCERCGKVLSGLPIVSLPQARGFWGERGAMECSPSSTKPGEAPTPRKFGPRSSLPAKPSSAPEGLPQKQSIRATELTLARSAVDPT